MVRRSTGTTGLLAVVGLLVAALVGTFWQYQRATRATVPEVAAYASLSTRIAPAEALQVRVGTLGFPQRVEGFKPLGGSAFEVGGRDAAAVVFGRGEQRLTYSIVSGGGHVNYYDRAGLYAPTESYVDGRELQWYGDEMVVVKRNGQTIVITGTPASDELRRVMRRVAVRS
jgi:hypothetical protein